MSNNNNWTHKNMPDRQHCVQFRKSPKCAKYSNITRSKYCRSTSSMMVRQNDELCSIRMHRMTNGPPPANNQARQPSINGSKHTLTVHTECYDERVLPFGIPWFDTHSKSCITAEESVIFTKMYWTKTVTSAGSWIFNLNFLLER